MSGISGTLSRQSYCGSFAILAVLGLHRPVHNVALHPMCSETHAHTHHTPPSSPPKQGERHIQDSSRQPSTAVKKIQGMVGTTGKPAFRTYTNMYAKPGCTRTCNAQATSTCHITNTWAVTAAHGAVAHIQLSAAEPRGQLNSGMPSKATQQRRDSQAQSSNARAKADAEPGTAQHCSRPRLQQHRAWLYGRPYLLHATPQAGLALLAWHCWLAGSAAQRGALARCHTASIQAGSTHMYTCRCSARLTAAQPMYACMHACGGPGRYRSHRATWPGGSCVVQYVW